MHLVTLVTWPFGDYWTLAGGGYSVGEPKQPTPVTARQIVEQHGGTVAVASEPSAGTTFTIRLPPTAKACV